MDRMELQRAQKQENMQLSLKTISSKSTQCQTWIIRCSAVILLYNVQNSLLKNHLESWNFIKNQVGSWQTLELITEKPSNKISPMPAIEEVKICRWYNVNKKIFFNFWIEFLLWNVVKLLRILNWIRILPLNSSNNF